MSPADRDQILDWVAEAIMGHPALKTKLNMAMRVDIARLAVRAAAGYLTTTAESSPELT